MSDARQLLGFKGASETKNIWKLRLQLTKPITWIPLLWGVICGAAASGNFEWTFSNVLASLACMLMSGPLLAGYTQTINDFFDNTNESLSYNLESRDIEYYGNIFIQIIRENDESFILELLDKDFNVVRKEKTSDEADLYVFRHLPPGDYYVRYIKDLKIIF